MSHYTYNFHRVTPYPQRSIPFAVDPVGMPSARRAFWIATAVVVSTALLAVAL